MARLAGIPDPVLIAARGRLQALEQSQAGQDPVQKDLFSVQRAEPTLSPEQTAVLASLAALEPDELSPRAALDALYALKQSLKDAE